MPSVSDIVTRDFSDIVTVSDIVLVTYYVRIFILIRDPIFP